MKIRHCVVCDLAMEVPARSSKKYCTPCSLERKRDYAHDKYLENVASGAIVEYRKRAAKQMNEKYKSDIIYRMLSRAKPRAKIMGIEFDLNREDITLPGVCPVLGTPFEFKTYYTASLDRIDSSKGYIKGNVQVMSHKANAMKNSATREELIKFAEWVLNAESV